MRAIKADQYPRYKQTIDAMPSKTSKAM